MNKAIRIVLVSLLATVGFAQNYSTVTASAVKDRSGNLVTGTIEFTPDREFGVGGKACCLKSAPLKAVLTAGGFTLSVPNKTATTPSGVCFTVTAKDAAGNVVLGPDGYRCVQPVGGSYNFDTYISTLGATASGGVTISGYYVQDLPKNPRIGTVAWAVDCEASSACVLGTGSTKNLLRFNGTTWDIASGSANVTGLADPGANGVVFRLTSSSTRVAVWNDIKAMLSGTCDSTHAVFGDGSCQTVAGGSGSGTVTSVDITVPGFLSVSGNPVTTSGTFTITASSQTQNKVLASPNGSSGAMTPRALVAADIPALAESAITNLTTDLAAKAALASPTFTGTVIMPAPTLNNVTGSTQCLHANTSGVTSGIGADCNVVASVFGTTGAVGNLSGAVTTSGSSVTSPGKDDVLDAVNFCSDAGSNDTYACSLSPAITGYVTGNHYRFKANTANTGAATVNLNSLGAKTIKKVAGGITTDLADNDIRVGQWIDVVYDGTNMQMQSLLGNAAAGGSGAPAGSTGETQINIGGGLFGSIVGTNFTNSTSLGTGGISNFSINSPTITVGHATNAYHVIDLIANANVSSLGMTTEALIYGILNNTSTGGTFGHQLGFVSRVGDSSTGSTITEVDGFYTDFNTGGSATSGVATSVAYQDAGGTISGGSGAEVITNKISFNSSIPTINSPATVTKFIGAALPALTTSNAQLGTLLGLNIGNCNSNGTGSGGNLYAAMAICGGESNFQSPIFSKFTLQAAGTLPVTNTNIFGYKGSHEIDSDIGDAIGISETVFALGNSSQSTAFNGVVENDNTTTTTAGAVYRAKYRSTGGGNFTTAYGLLVQAPDNTAGNTIGQGYGVYVADLNVGTETNPPYSFFGNNTISGKAYNTLTNCSSGASPAVCSSASAGSVAVPTGTNPTLTVNTTAITANSQIFLQSDDTLGTKLSVTCNSTLTLLATEPVVTARTAGTSFQITISGVVSTNPVCLSYHIVN